MFNTLYLLNYNNYYNRLVKQEETLEDYLDYMVAALSATNFNPNDHIATTHICNIDDDITPDYAIVTDVTGNIVSRWFVVESVRIRGNQYRLSLYRDTVVDYYNIIIDSPCFIEKASLSFDNPLIFNNENMTFNQIKTEEHTLKDKSGCPWLIGYYAKDSSNIEVTVPTNNMANLNYIPLGIPAITDWEYYSLQTTEMVGPAQSGTYDFKAALGSALNPSYAKYQVNKDSGDTTRTSISNTTVQLQNSSVIREAQMKEAFVSYGLSKFNPVPYSNEVTQSKVEDLLKYQGALVKTLDGAYYEVLITTTNRTETISIQSGALFNELTAVLRTLNFYGTPNASTFSYTFLSTYYSITLKERTDIETTCSFGDTHLITTNAPWNIFAIPYGEITIKGAGDADIITNANIGISLASALNQQHQSKIFDIQLLPYCPIQELIEEEGEIRVRNESQYSLVIGPENTKVGIVFHIAVSNFTFDIATIDIPIATSAIERKVNSECDKWRLCSPNYSNYFDFNAEKNNGVQFFNVDCNYKPYNPYIHINPNFGGLYGNDYNDPRGLILGGDFSISQIGDAWKQYEIQNKNYQLSFDRQIQNIEINNSVQRTQQKASIALGSVQALGSGSYLGSVVSKSGMGSVIGGMVGATASAAAGAIDYKLSEVLRNEAIDLTTDQFGYQLGNIQALPQTISKVSTFNLNNKIFPVLEYYTATDTEKEALRNKIKYNGMTAMVIGNIKDYINDDRSYIKGQIIRLDKLNDDTHIANTIAKEIYQGIYI